MGGGDVESAPPAPDRDAPTAGRAHTPACCRRGGGAVGALPQGGAAAEGGALSAPLLPEHPPRPCLLPFLFFAPPSPPHFPPSPPARGNRAIGRGFNWSRQGVTLTPRPTPKAGKNENIFLYIY